ncbi:MAG: hypothetical protein WD627_11605 [Actinomycetota bacterium]
MTDSADARHRHLRRFMVLVLALVLGACGGDDPGGTEDEGEDQAASTEEYCANSLAIETVADPDIDFDALSPEQQAEEAKKFATGTLRPLADRLIASAPEELEDDAAVADAALTELEQTGDFDAVFSNPETIEAFNNLHDFDLENCDWEQVDVVASEYKFDGVPATMPAGVTSFEFDNNGTEQHEMVIFRKKDGDTMSFDQILAIEDEAEVETHVDFVGATFGEPNDPEDLYAISDVKPGDYVMVCFVPVGSTPEAVEAAEAANEEIEGPPHFQQGMKAEFKVTA